MVAEVVIGESISERTRHLHACILVARSWVPRSRIQLYRDVMLWSDLTTRRFLNSLALYSALGQYVESLRVRPKNKDEKTCGWIFKLISTLPRLLPHLRELHFCELPDLRSECIIVLSRFRTVEFLGLYDLRQQSLREVIQLISRLPHLRRLRVTNCTWKLPGRYYSGKQHNLTTLHVNSWPDYDRSFLEWALASKSTGDLTTFRAGSDVAGSATHRILETCFSTLRQLHLYLDDNDGEWLWMLFFHMLTCSPRYAVAHKSSQFATSRFAGKRHSCALSLSSLCTKLPCQHPRSLFTEKFEDL